VFNTSLAEASIVRRGIGMPCAGSSRWPRSSLDYIWPAYMQIRNSWR